MTRDEATKQAEDLPADWFCPLIRNRCNTMCVCYVEPAAVNLKLGISYRDRNIVDSQLSTITSERKELYKEDWTIEGNLCGNAMFYND